MNKNTEATPNQEDKNSQIDMKPYFNIEEELVDFNEWCISEKSYWGIPVPYFINKNTGKTLINKEIILNVAKIITEQGGSDAWYRLTARELLPDSYKDQASDLIKGDEVFDVWFDKSLSWKTAPGLESFHLKMIEGNNYINLTRKLIFKHGFNRILQDYYSELLGCPLF